MKIDAAPRILVVAAICAISLIGVVIAEGAARASGQEVLLPIQAIDPRTILGGHYVQFDITQTLSSSEHCPDQRPNWDWIALRPLGGGVYGVAGGADSRDQTEQIGPVSVKGEYVCSAPTPVNSENPGGVNGWIRLQIGIDRFYASQTDAERVAQVLSEQRADEQSRAYAIVSVGRDGQARLKGLQIGGKRIELNWL
jgi:hypothetical protein